MTLDEERYAFFLTYNTIGNSILFNKLIKLGNKIDSHIGRPFGKFFKWTEKIFFSGWENIHPIAWGGSEEDEALFVFNYSSPVIGVIYPFMKTYDWVNFPDEYTGKKAKRLKNFYKNSIKRFMYSDGKGKTLLSKNVFSTGRIILILDCFPDARIIYPVRHPYESVPSLISMFAKPWKSLYKFIPENSEEFRQWGKLAIQFYQYFYQISKELPDSQFFSVGYDELVSNPENVIEQIYFHFGMEMSPEFKKRLKESTQKSKNFKSKHSYSIEEYGLSKQVVYEQLKPVFEKYGFKP
jgi:hypothetical protein